MKLFNTSGLVCSVVPLNPLEPDGNVGLMIGPFTTQEAIVVGRKFLRSAVDRVVGSREKAKIEYPFVPGDGDFEVPDFSKAAVGSLVVRSDYWKESHHSEAARGQVGIITGFEYFTDSKCRAICHPNVFWEGKSHTSTQDPIDAELKEGELPRKMMDSGQWGTYGPKGKEPIDKEAMMPPKN